MFRFIYRHLTSFLGLKASGPVIYFLTKKICLITNTLQTHSDFIHEIEEKFKITWKCKNDKYKVKNTSTKISYFSVRVLSYWARGKFGEHERGLRKDFCCRAFFRAYTRIIDAMYGRPRVNLKVKRRSTLKCTRDLPYILFTRVKFMCVRKGKSTRQWKTTLRVARGAAESNSSLLSALQTSQSAQYLDIRPVEAWSNCFMTLSKRSMQQLTH